MALSLAEWRRSGIGRQTLCRGDAADEVRLPDPAAAEDIVGHILCFHGRHTPYLSTSETYEQAQHFAGGGRVWQTTATSAESRDVKHLSRTEILGILNRKSQRFSNNHERLKAMDLVRRHAEHLLNFRSVSKLSESELRRLVTELFT